MGKKEPVRFYVLVIGANAENPKFKFLQVSIAPTHPVREVLDVLQQNYSQHEVLQGISNQCLYYALKKPLEFDDENPPDVRQITNSLGNDNEYKKMDSDWLVKRIAKEFDDEWLQLVIMDVPDETGIAVETLKKDYDKFYHCLLIKVQKALKWTRADVLANGGSFIVGDGAEKPQEIVDLENSLRKKRSFDIPEDDPDLTNARRYATEFERSYFRVDDQQGQVVAVKSSSEFFAFYALVRRYIPDIPQYDASKSSTLKGHALKANFLLPPFLSERPPTDDLAYIQETSLKFPLFVSCEAMSPLPRKYTPMSDFSVWFQQNLDFPLMIGEVISQPDEQDRYRMLLQGIALARLANEILLPQSKARPFIIAIYLTADLIAEMYIMMQEEKPSKKVYISRTKFDLTNRDAAIDFQRAMYNLIPQLEHVLAQLDPRQKTVLATMKAVTSKMKSLNSRGAWHKPDQSRSMTSIPEESSEPELADDLGVFADENVTDALAEINCEVAYVVFGHPNIALIVNLTTERAAGALKFVKDGGQEIEILQYLAGLTSESNHTVRPLGIWPVTGGSIIAMPVAGGHITDLKNLDTHLWPLAKQLFEAVSFMHGQNVAHMDLKPHNLLIPSEYGRLTVIDFGLAVHLSDEAQLLKGYVGTKGYIAPEVGRGKFSPIRADLWSVGKVVQELCMLCSPSIAREWLLSVSKQLLHLDPSKRPMMLDVLRQMCNFDAVETLHDDKISVVPVPSMLSGVAAVGA